MNQQITSTAVIVLTTIVFSTSLQILLSLNGTKNPVEQHQKMPPKVDSVFRTRSLGIAASGLTDQYSDGKAAKVWHLYIGGKKRTEEYKNLLTKVLEDHNVKTVLDSACGTGVDSILLLDAGYNVSSLDASDKMLKYALKTRWSRRKEKNIEDWQIGEGDWLDLANCEDSVTHPEGGYDAIICIGNSFAHLPDFAGNQDTHKLAINNFYQLIKPGGILIIDHRNYDYIIKHGKLPNTTSKLYYQGNSIYQIKTSVLNVDGEVTMITLDYEIDISGTGLADGSEIIRVRDGNEVPISQFRLSYYPHTLDKFNALLEDSFGADAKHDILADFIKDPPADYIASYWIHVIKKKE